LVSYRCLHDAVIFHAEGCGTHVDTTNGDESFHLHAVIVYMKSSRMHELEFVAFVANQYELGDVK